MYSSFVRKGLIQLLILRALARLILSLSLIRLVSLSSSHNYSSTQTLPSFYNCVLFNGFFFTLINLSIDNYRYIRNIVRIIYVVLVNLHTADSGRTADVHRYQSSIHCSSHSQQL